MAVSIELEKAVSANQIGMQGISFVEFSTPDPLQMESTFYELGFSFTAEKENIKLFQQNDISFFLNADKNSFARHFAEIHGPCISAMGWKFKDAETAYNLALNNGAQGYSGGDYAVPAIYGIGGSLIYFIDEKSTENSFARLGFKPAISAKKNTAKGFLRIDHLTNNVVKGTMEEWSHFYKNIFGFTEVRTFHIHGKKTGLQSYALRSPCGNFCIPINEADEKKSQINEYLEEYKGPGVQHLALLTEDILSSLRQLEGTSIKTLDIKEDYYRSVFDRVPNVKEDKKEIERRQVLVDGDTKGYLLQIFTKNIFGPIFFEIIQRKNHLSFGEGNFQALFDSIERDQIKRGVFNAD